MAAPSLAPYLALAVGVGLDDAGVYEIYSFWHLDEDAAEMNLERFAAVVAEGESYATTRPWREFLNVEAAGVRDTTSVFTVRPTSAPIGIRAIQTRDSLFAMGTTEE